MGPAPHFLLVLLVPHKYLSKNKGKGRSLSSTYRNWFRVVVLKVWPQITSVSITRDLVRKASEWELGGRGDGTLSPQASLRPILRF